ncbi:unnamed protein product [Schistocephalus solidus]|uniref:Integrase catalytic domain-containing protein n=1 Tax=Schistocephalus solidus TaxID=70667 RepID=A0A3P7CRK7_SCHSO|nr:unnamed protein product [Schistocephalus solidus]
MISSTPGDYISQFTSDIRPIDGSRHEVADAVSRPFTAKLQLTPGIDLMDVASEQRPIGSPGDEDVSGPTADSDNDAIFYDVAIASHRLFVLRSHRYKVFSSIHKLSHPLSRVTDKWLSNCFVKTFYSVVGSKPFADVVVKLFLSRWVAIFSALSTTTTDRGAHFEPNLFQSLLSFSGFTHIRMTVYHPAANGMVDGFHRQMMISLRATDNPENWTDPGPFGHRLSTAPPLKRCLPLLSDIPEGVGQSAPEIANAAVALSSCPPHASGRFAAGAAAFWHQPINVRHSLIGCRRQSTKVYPQWGRKVSTADAEIDLPEEAACGNYLQTLLYALSLSKS